MDSAKPFQVGVFLTHPPISSLSLWERARVRGSYGFNHFSDNAANRPSALIRSSALLRLA